MKSFSRYYRESTAQDHKVITIEARDPDNNLAKLLSAIAGIGNGGHSFSIVVDPDVSKKNGGSVSVGWDGDGADRIIKVTVDGEQVYPEEKDEDVS